MGDSASRLSCYDAIAVGAAAPAAAVARQGDAARAPVAAHSAAANAPVGNQAEQRFGMEKAQLASSMESTIEGDFDGWGPGAEFKLSNGQVWRVVDGSKAVESRTRNPKVRIERGFLGVLYMRIEGVNLAPKVRRVR